MPKGNKLAERVAAGEISPKQALVMALNHPLRIDILVHLTEHVASPNEMQHALDASLSDLSYHTRVLAELGQVELVKKEQRRGAIEHWFRAINRPLFDDPDWESFEPAVRRAISAYGVERVFRDAAQALRSGSFDARPDRHFSRTPLNLDEQGWREANEVLNEGLDELLKVQGRANERLANTEGRAPVHAVAAMSCFELYPEEPRRG